MTRLPAAPLRRLFRVVNGGTPTSDDDNWGGDIQWATPVDLGRVHGNMLQGTDRTLSKKGLQSGSAAVPAGSLIVSTRAPIGYVAEATVRTAFNQGCRGLVPTRELDIRFYRYVIVAMAAQMQAAGQGSTFVELSADALAQQRVPMPPLPFQRAIADFLDSETARIDVLVSLKRQLEQLLFVRWKADLCRTLLPGGIDEITGRANEPCGWEARPIRHLISKCWGGDWGQEAGHESVDLECVRAADFDFVRLKAVHGVPRSFALGSASSRALFPGDLVIEKSGGGEGVPIGRVVAWRGTSRALPTNFAGGLRPAEGIEGEFLLLALRAAYEVGLPWRSIKQTTGLQNLDVGHYLSHHVPIPPRSDQRVIANRLLAQLERVLVVQEKLQHQISLLQEHRQALITAAVTGELGIPGAAM